MSSDDISAGTGASAGGPDIPFDLESDDFVDSLLSAVESQVLDRFDQTSSDGVVDEASVRPSAPELAADRVERVRGEHIADGGDTSAEHTASESADHPDEEGKAEEVDPSADPLLGGDVIADRGVDEVESKLDDPDPVVANDPVVGISDHSSVGEAGFLEEIDEDLFGEALGLEADERGGGPFGWLSKPAETDADGASGAPSDGSPKGSSDVPGAADVEAPVHGALRALYHRERLLVVGIGLILAMGVIAVILDTIMTR